MRLIAQFMLLPVFFSQDTLGYFSHLILGEWVGNFACTILREDSQLHSASQAPNYVHLNPVVVLVSRTLTLLSRALRLRWLWYGWDDEGRPWKGIIVPCNEVDRQPFAACTSTEIKKNGKNVFFRRDRLPVGALNVFAPALHKLSARKNFSVKEVLTGRKWVKGLDRIKTQAQTGKFIQIQEMTHHLQLNNNAQDSISWKVPTNDHCSVGSAYALHILSNIQNNNVKKVWIVSAEGNVCFFLWLLLQDRVWTAERLRDRGWPHNTVCTLCDQS